MDSVDTMDNQKQKSGDNSVNIQAGGNVNFGLTYQDAKQIALDVFEQNFFQLVGVANEVATQRAEEITEEFLKELQKRNPEGIKCAQDPDFQYALFTAQKEYARSGNKDLEGILVDLLVDRTKAPEESLQKIVLNEAINVVPKLTKEQIAVLHIAFVIRYVIDEDIVSLERLAKHFEDAISPFLPFLPKDDITFQHLQYTGCGFIRSDLSKVHELFRGHYPKLFSKGIEGTKLKEALGDYPPEFVIPCLHNENLLQFNTDNGIGLIILLQKYGLAPKPKDFIFYENLYKELLMNDEEIETALMKVHADFVNLLIMWDNTHLGKILLTSVGIAIAHANYCRITGSTSPLSLWIK
jgi:hypothetical protein